MFPTILIMDYNHWYCQQAPIHGTVTKTPFWGLAVTIKMSGVGTRKTVHCFSKHVDLSSKTWLCFSFFFFFLLCIGNEWLVFQRSLCCWIRRIASSRPSWAIQWTFSNWKLGRLGMGLTGRELAHDLGSIWSTEEKERKVTYWKLGPQWDALNKEQDLE